MHTQLVALSYLMQGQLVDAVLMCVCVCTVTECLCVCISMIKSQSGCCYDDTCIFKLLIQDYSPLRSSHYRQLLKNTYRHTHAHTNTNYGLVSLETEHMLLGSPKIT